MRDNQKSHVKQTKENEKEKNNFSVRVNHIPKNEIRRER